MVILFESQLIQKAKEDPDAFAELYERYFEKTYAFIRSRVRFDEDAEDLCSLLWESILKKIKNLKGSQAEVFRAWIFQIARSLISDHYRKNNRFLSPIEDHENSLFYEENYGEALDKKAKLKDIKDWIQNLSDRQVEMIQLKFFAELKNREIAKILGLSEKTISAHLSRAIEKIQEREKKHRSAFLKKTTLKSDGHPETTSL